MNDWIVVVKRRGESKRQRVFVENVQHEDEAETLALLKIGGNSHTHEARAERVDEKVSPDNPDDNKKILYEQALVDLEESRRISEEQHVLAATYFEFSKKLERERDGLIRNHTRALTDLAQVKFTIENIQENLEKRGV